MAATKFSKKTSATVGQELHEFKRGQLKSGRSGRTVTSRKQAIAIGLSEARAAGEKVPPPPAGPASARKTTAKKASAKKTPAKKTSAKKSAAKKTQSKKSAAKKAPAKNVATKRALQRRAP